MTDFCGEDCQRNWAAQFAADAERDPQVGDPVLVSGTIESIHEGVALVALYRTWPLNLSVPVQCGALEYDQKTADAVARAEDEMVSGAEFPQVASANPQVVSDPYPARGWLSRVFDRLFGRTT